MDIKVISINGSKSMNDRKINISNGRNYGGEKETMNTWSLIAYTKGEFKQIICVRSYMGRSTSASVVYSSAWISSYTSKHSISVSGRGQAGGYGYHKTSSAVAQAFEGAGITLNHHISGAGDAAIEDAMKAIAKKLGYTKFTVVKG